MLNQRIHTGCSCQACKRGKDKETRAEYHRKLRRKQKRELKQNQELDTISPSIGYTD